MSETRVPPPDDDVLATSQAGPAAVRGGALRVGGYLLGVALSVLSAALLFRHLGVRDGGRYVTVISLAALFGALTEAGLASIAVRELAAGADAGRRELMRDLLGLRLALSFVAGVAAIGFAAAVGYDDVMVAGVAVAALAMVLQNLQYTLSAALTAGLRFGWVAGLELLRQVVAVACIVALVASGAGLLAFVAVLVVAGAASLVPTVVLVRGAFPLRPAVRWDRWKRLLRDVGPYAAATAVAAVYYRIALILLSLVSNETETGYFGASFRVSEVLLGVPVLAVSAAFPIFARAATNDVERLRFGVQRVLDASVLAGALVMVTLVVGAPFVIDVVAGSEFAPAADVLRLQAVGVFGTFLAAVWGYALLALGRHRTILVLAIVPLIINAGLTLALAPGHGAMGAALATAIGELVLAAGGAYAFARAMGQGVVRFGTVARALLVAAPCCALALVDGVPSVVLAAAAGLLYAGLAFATGAIPRDLVQDLLARKGA